MLLREWLSTKKMSEAEFARVSGIGMRQLVHKYATGSGFPGPENLLRIRNATDGAVTADDFVTLHASLNPPKTVAVDAQAAA